MCGMALVVYSRDSAVVAVMVFMVLVVSAQFCDGGTYIYITVMVVLGYI